ncbi:cysteine desulfurase family protein [Salibacterium halotolerans]|uniref:Cysteine desulfurase n=1 Tax=Salibacterium halotolerans TaxID=1884432 RepID=A0A1I5VJ54_9BACI|nr:cysteine desulfurase family protein [Salibacterium halotolerans]SFQ07337.1 cysteine desulfurase [Salibacterium halotolerans]
MVYLDNSATTKPWPEVLDAYYRAASDYFGNPSSLHHPGVEAETLLNKGRASVAGILNVNTEEIVFTSGGTESNNTAIKGIAVEHKERGNHLITSSAEHPSVTQAFQELEYFGFDVTYVDVDEEGRVQVEDVLEAVREDTILVSIIHVNNELGTINPVEDTARALKAYPKLFFHTDHVQGAGHVPLDLQDVDLCTISGHKIHGLKGTGALFVRRGTALSPLLHGGSQEQQFRAGTENVPGITALAKALRLSDNERQQQNGRLEDLKQHLIQHLHKLEGAVVNTPKTGSAPHIVNVSFPGMKPEVLVQELTRNNIHVSTKSACASKLQEPSPLLLAAGLGTERASSAVRVSFSHDTEDWEVEEFVRTLHKAVSDMMQVMGEKK